MVHIGYVEKSGVSMGVKRPVILLIYLAVLIAPDIFGQPITPDSSLVTHAVASAASNYDAAMINQLRLYNGVEYNAYPEPYEDFPYFESEYWEEGSICYYGEWYHGVPMQYDLLNDLLVIEHYNQSGYGVVLQLHTDKVDAFELLGHSFIRISGDSSDASGLRPGFYDLLYDGESRVVCKKRKDVLERVESGTVSVSFVERTHYYIMKDGAAVPVRNKGTVLKALADKKKALKQFARKEKVFFIDKEESIVQLVRYYDTLK